MNLLLLLSALLSALTGAGASVRQPQQASAVVQRAHTLVIAPVQVRRTERPRQSAPRLAAVAPLRAIALATLPTIEPRYLTRLRV